MEVNFVCSNLSCRHKVDSGKWNAACPICNSLIEIDIKGINSVIHESLLKLPPHISRPLFLIYSSSSYFKRLHLIPDLVLGTFRLYGLILLEVLSHENLLGEKEAEFSERIQTKDDLGSWLSFISSAILILEKSQSRFQNSQVFNVFGIQSNQKKIKVKQLTVSHVVIDELGRKKERETKNPPIQLLVNFRNKYVRHGIVYSEEESRQIFDLYEPILLEFLKSLNSVNYQFYEAQTKEKLTGFHVPCFGNIQVNITSGTLAIPYNSLLVTPSLENGFNIGSQFNMELGIPYFLDQEDEKIVNRYPYLLALPYERTLVEKDGYKRLHLLKETFLNYLKYLALVTASEYFSSDLKIKEINREFKALLFRPLFGNWNAFVRKATKELNANNHQWFVKELPVYYEEIELAPFHSGDQTAIRNLIEFRNAHLAHGQVPTFSACNQLWDTYFPILKDLLLKMDFCKSYTLISKEKVSAWRLMGNHISQINLRENFTEKGSIALVDSKGRHLSLVPFFILPGSYFTKDISSRTKLMIYEQNTGSRMVFFSPESVRGETNNQKILTQLNLMIKEKDRLETIKKNDLDPTTWCNMLNEANHEVLRALWSERKIIKGVYQERRDGEITLRSWVGAHAGLFFLVAPAGSGKTNLLAEMINQYKDFEVESLLLRGLEFHSSDFWKEVQNRLNLDVTVQVTDLSFLNLSQNKPMMILVDGLNEHPKSVLILNGILEFIKKNSGGHIKVVVTWRANSHHEIPKIKESYEEIVFSSNYTKDFGVDILGLIGSNIPKDRIEKGERNHLERSAYWLKPLNKLEIEGAWNQLVDDKSSPIGRRPKFTYEELVYHDRYLSDQLDNPLLMRLFMEINHDKGLPRRRGGFISIWELYHEYITNK
jgi:hypothetical protein